MAPTVTYCDCPPAARQAHGSRTSVNDHARLSSIEAKSRGSPTRSTASVISDMAGIAEALSGAPHVTTASAARTAGGSGTGSTVPIATATSDAVPLLALAVATLVTVVAAGLARRHARDQPGVGVLAASERLTR